MFTETVEIIEAQEKDIPEILGFTDIFLRRDWMIKKQRLMHYVKNCRVLIVRSESRIIGIGICTKESCTLYLLYVHPKHRSKKLGFKLLQELKPQIIRARINQTTGNPVPYYEKLGYVVEVARDPKNRNICIMRKP